MIADNRKRTPAAPAIISKTVVARPDIRWRKGAAMNRRELFTMTSATAATAMAASRFDPARIRTRRIGKVETVCNSPGPAPNGLQATREGLWIIDQGAGNKAYLVTYEGGKVLRS